MCFLNALQIAIPVVLFVLSLACPSIAGEPIRSVEGVVVRVTDGDTVKVDASGTLLKVRLYGIDAPETMKTNRKSGRVTKLGQMFGEDAWRALEAKVLYKRVRLDIIDIDRYRRNVGVLWVGRRNVNVEMVADGWAWAYRDYLQRPHAGQYLDSEEVARRNRKGIWYDANPEPPWEFRRGLKRLRG